MKDHKTILKLLLLWLMLFFYVTLHESGHVLSALLFGGKITYFNLNIFNASMNYSGNFSNIQASIFHISGFALPFIIWFVFISSFPKKTKKPILEYIKVYSFAIFTTCIPWIIIPMLYLGKIAPKGDDTTNFLEKSSINGFIVSSLFLLLLIVSYKVWRIKTPDFKKILLSKEPVKLKKLTLIILVCLSVISLSLMTFPLINNRIQVEEGYNLYYHSKLNEIKSTDIKLYKFRVKNNKQTENIQILVIGKNIYAKTFNFKLKGPNGETFPFADTKNLSGGVIKYKKNLDLKPGEYTFIITGLNTKGDLYIYLKRDNK